jgi:hypothetical protein
VSVLWTSGDRWTCPVCTTTEVPDVPVAELPAALRAVQEAHAADHPAPWVEPTRARHPLRRKADAANKARRAQARAAL